MTRTKARELAEAFTRAGAFTVASVQPAVKDWFLLVTYPEGSRAIYTEADARRELERLSKP